MGVLIDLARCSHTATDGGPRMLTAVSVPLATSAPPGKRTDPGFHMSGNPTFPRDTRIASELRPTRRFILRKTTSSRRGKQTAVAILYYKLARVPWHVGNSACEFHAVSCVLRN